MGGGSTAGNAGQLMSVSGSIGGQTESAAYTYDNVGRLVTSNQTSNGVSAQRRFVYDRWGNRTEVWNATSGGSQIQAVSLEQSGGIPTNRITSVTEGSTLNYSYDSAGNVTNDGAHSYTYDAENRVVSVDGGSTATYSYDHQNRRVKKTVGSTTTHYVWQGGQVIAEHNGSTGAVLTDYIFAGGRMIAREQSGRVFFLYDRLSVRATITDGQGNIQGRQSHLPFGEELNATGTTDKHRFTSYERDSETGTDYAVNRQYSQGVGRFTRPDPYGGSYNVGNPQSMNRYAYVQNDPVNAVDPLGLDFGGGGIPYPGVDYARGCILIQPPTDFSGQNAVIWCPDAPPRARGPEDHGQRRRTRRRARFSLAKLKECVETLFGAQIVSFTEHSVQIFGPDTISNNGNNATYTVTYDYTFSGGHLALLSPDPNDSWIHGIWRSRDPYTVLIANDINTRVGNNADIANIVNIATQVHELAHAVAYIGGLGDPSSDDGFAGEEGYKLEECVFGGIVADDGRVDPIQ